MKNLGKHIKDLAIFALILFLLSVPACFLHVVIVSIWGTGIEDVEKRQKVVDYSAVISLIGWWGYLIYFMSMLNSPNASADVTADHIVNILIGIVLGIISFIAIINNLDKYVSPGIDD